MLQDYPDYLQLPEQQIGEVTVLNMMGERVAKLERVRIQGIHLSGYKLTDYQQYTSLRAESVCLDGWNKFIGFGTVLLVKVTRVIL